MTSRFDYTSAMAFIHERSGYDRGFISNPFAGDDAARLGLVRTERVLTALGRPDRGYPILHVAGSKGKGSTSTLLSSVHSAAGWRCGRFLSPHLHRFNERFAIDDLPISDEDFAACVDAVRSASLAVERNEPEIGRLTAWELSTAIALLWFDRQQCDVVVLEVGMGGTLDATNVVQPAASLITRLDLEHTDILGNTIAEVAANKAGIIKPGAPAYSVGQEPEALAVIQSRAAAVGSSLAVAGVDWQVSGDSEDFSWSGWDASISHLSTGLEGLHQVENAGLAIAAIMDPANTLAERLPISEANLRSGLASAFIPGRFEIIDLDGATVVLDGAHTPASARALADATITRFGDHHVTVIVAMLADKDPFGFLEPLVPVANSWIISQPQSPRALHTDLLLAALHHFDCEGQPAGSVAEGLTEAINSAQNRDRPALILVTGSISTVAEARTMLGLDRTSG